MYNTAASTTVIATRRIVAMIGDTPRLLDFLFLQRSIPRSMFSPWDVPSTLSRPQMRIYTLAFVDRQLTSFDTVISEYSKGKITGNTFHSSFRPLPRLHAADRNVNVSLPRCRALQGGFFMTDLWSDFKAFVTKGDVVNLAVGIIIGLAFQAVVTALVTDLITPLIGVFGHFDFSSWQYTFHGSTFHQGAFLNSLVSFALIAVVVFFFIVRPYQMYQQRAASKAASPPPPATRDCPFCFTAISPKATRCPNCTSEVTPTTH
jgi:large conductance mechanosensitive channel